MKHHSTPRDEVQQLLDDLAAALTAGDGARAANAWDVPALVLGDQQVHAVATRQEVASFFGGAREQYNQRGITDTRAEILDLRWPTDRMAIAVVRWPYLDTQGREKGTETSTYVLRRDERGALKLRVAVMHGAAAS